jgi:hypothetical protein
MNKAAPAGAGIGVRNTAEQVARVLGRSVLGGLCGVGFVWALTVLWPPVKAYVVQFGRQLETFTSQYPVAMSGLLLGIFVALLWQAAGKRG